MMTGNLSAAPLDRTAKWVTVLVVLTACAFPFLPNMPIYVALLMPAVVFVSWLFSVKGYTIMNYALTVHRPFWDTEIVLPPDAVFRKEPEITKGLMKTAGNSGLFGYTGGFKNKKLGSFKAYATNWKHAVSITSESQGLRVVISPENSI
jgi:hypothetical protein